MSCYQCFQSFGLLNKEHSCKICRFSFCSKCLNNTIVAANAKGSNKVCKRCFLSETNKSKDTMDIPKNLQRLKEINESKTAKSEISDIEKRLNNLRPANKISTTEQLEERLQKLKGSNAPNTYKQGESQFYVKPKSYQNEVNELLAQSNNEVAIDDRMQTTNQERDKGIEERLNKLREGTGQCMSSSVKNVDNYLNADSVIEQIMNEIKIEDKFKESSFDTPGESCEELPYCCLCTNDAVWRCHDCDGDLYCGSCYKRCHKKSEYGSHSHESFKPLRK